MFGRKMILIAVAAATLSLWSCSNSKLLKPNDPQPQASVQIDLKNGQSRQGIIFYGNDQQVVFFNTADRKKDSVATGEIAAIRRLGHELDFEGETIPEQEISEHSKWTNTLLYGGAGLVLGSAAGTGLSIALFARQGDATSARITIAALAAVGAGFFGHMGKQADRQNGVIAARDARLQKLKELVEEKKRLLELEKKKAELLKKIKEKKGS